VELRIGVSACLLGENVRWDGGHKRHPFVLETLGGLAELVPVCPELELGLGVPREPIQLVRAGGSVELLGVRSGEDLTGRMRRYARERVQVLAMLGLSGYVLKSRSPSCGLVAVEVHDGRGGVEKKGVGLFAAALLEGLPGLPVEEESRLEDAAARKSFVERVLAYSKA
jgi:uncharacterized protein YbbK (DUF523 family)